MTGWKKEEIEIADGTKVSAQMPVIVSASRSTDIPAFYADWFIERFDRGKGYVKWHNPFNNTPLYVGFKKTRLIVFWSKNPKPMLEKLPGCEESPRPTRRWSGHIGCRQDDCRSTGWRGARRVWRQAHFIVIRPSD